MNALAARTAKSASASHAHSQLRVIDASWCVKPYGAHSNDTAWCDEDEAACTSGPSSRKSFREHHITFARHVRPRIEQSIARRIA